MKKLGRTKITLDSNNIICEGSKIKFDGKKN